MATLRPSPGHGSGTAGKPSKRRATLTPGTSPTDERLGSYVGLSHGVVGVTRGGGRCHLTMGVVPLESPFETEHDTPLTRGNHEPGRPGNLQLQGWGAHSLAQVPGVGQPWAKAGPPPCPPEPQGKLAPPRYSHQGPNPWKVAGTTCLELSTLLSQAQLGPCKVCTQGRSRCRWGQGWRWALATHARCNFEGSVWMSVGGAKPASLVRLGYGKA